MSFEQVCLPHYHQVEGLCQRMLGRSRAQDAAQETFIRAMQAYPSLHRPESARAWLLTIATRHCLDTLRRREDSAVEEELPDFQPDREHALLSQQILRAMPPRTRGLLILRHCLQLSYQEIAAVLEMPANQVGVALQRARQEALRFARERGMIDAVR